MVEIGIYLNYLSCGTKIQKVRLNLNHMYYTSHNQNAFIKYASFFMLNNFFSI